MTEHTNHHSMGFDLSELIAFFLQNNLKTVCLKCPLITPKIKRLSGDNLYTADQICRMVEFLIDNIFVKFGGCLFRQVIGIPMGTNCAPC